MELQGKKKKELIQKMRTDDPSLKWTARPQDEILSVLGFWQQVIDRRLRGQHRRGHVKTLMGSRWNGNDPFVGFKQLLFISFSHLCWTQSVHMALSPPTSDRPMGLVQTDPAHSGCPPTVHALTEHEELIYMVR